VIETRGAKAVAEALRQALVRPEHDAEQQRAMLAVGTARQSTRDEGAEPVGDASEPAPAADDAPPVDLEDDMDPVAAKIGPFVEPPLRPVGRRQHAEYLNDVALRR
jgi:hypothetical protein